MAPNQVSLLNVGVVQRPLQRNAVKETKKMYKYTTGDYVRLRLTKRLFKKHYLNNFTEEVFVIDERLPQNSLVYTVKGLLDCPIEITFYMEELQNVTKPEIF